MSEKSIYHVGVKVEDKIKYSILAELLNQQGILFERTDDGSNHPCFIDPETNSPNIIDSKNIDYSSLFEMLAGISESSYNEDKLCTVPLNQQAESIAAAVKASYFKQGLPFIRKTYWPNFAPACAIITHDIDTLNNPPVGQKLEFVKYAMARKVKGQPYNDNIDNIKIIEKENGVNSSFYFFQDYGKHQAHLKKVLKYLDKKDEIALHGSQHSFQSTEQLEKEKKTLEAISTTKIDGIRQHGLNFMVPHTWRYQEKAGFDYDLTHAYNDKFGFRAGTCHPFHPFDSLTKNRFNILELPTSFMDWTVHHQGLDYSETIEKIKEICSVIEKYNGVFISIFHNLYINEKTCPDVTNSFVETIKYLKEKKYWITTAKECSTWWRMRENAKLNFTTSSDGLLIQSDTTLPLEISYPDGKIKKVIVEAGKKLECQND